MVTNIHIEYIAIVHCVAGSVSLGVVAACEFIQRSNRSCNVNIGVGANVTCDKFGLQALEVVITRYNCNGVRSTNPTTVMG